MLQIGVRKGIHCQSENLLHSCLFFGALSAYSTGDGGGGGLVKRAFQITSLSCPCKWDP